MNVAKRLSNEKVVQKFARKLAFSKFVQTKKKETDVEGEAGWNCCSTNFTEITDIHRHVSRVHKDELNEETQNIVKNGDECASYAPLKKKQKVVDSICSTSDERLYHLPESFSDLDEFPWLPKYNMKKPEVASHNEGKIILFYCYREIVIPNHVKCWQETLCHRLSLTGKIRVACEGLNATVGGDPEAVDIYIEAVRKHPLFDHMQKEDFKVSQGSASDFPAGLKVGVYKEAVPMGIDAQKVSYKEAGKHLTPEEFHQAVQECEVNTENNSVFIDCRNFYESKIGHFQGAVCPDIRKFSYWPEYVDQNKELFQDKKVYMYCTGGIRCERGSAYLKSQSLCQEVFQLKGGIHKYIEKYPDGYFRGKMFVFDDRYHLKANEDILSKCRYCGEPYDQYSPCSSAHCHQLVLSCDSCRERGLTACCTMCQTHSEEGERTVREECECTGGRARVPVEQSPAGGVQGQVEQEKQQ